MSIDLSDNADMSFKPNLSIVNKILDEDIVGEYESRLSLFTSWILSECRVIMSGPRSSGKTWISDHVKGFIGELKTEEGGEDGGRCYTLSAGSDKSAWYDMQNIVRADFIIVLELNKIPKEAQEILKDWGEGKESKYKTVITEGGYRKIKVFRLPPKPFIFCLADEEEARIGEQLLSRLICIRTDATVTQNKAVLAQQAKLAKEMYNVKRVDKQLKENLKEHIRTMPPMDKYSFKHPASDLFMDSIPSFFTDSRRDFPKYLSNVAGICRFHWKERIIDEEQKLIFITPQDMYLNHIVFANILIESALKVSNIEREIIHTLKSIGSLSPKKEIQKELRKKGINVSAHMIARHLNSLSDVGYLNKEQSTKGKEILYEAGEFFDEFKFSVDWKKVIQSSLETMKTHYPTHYEQYKKRFCDNPIVINPFTGKGVNLLELQSDDIQPSKQKITSFLLSEKKSPDNSNAKPDTNLRAEVPEEVDVMEVINEEQEMEVVEEDVV